MENYINIINRSIIQIKGIDDIIEYNNNKIILRADSSQIIITGNDFNIKKFDIENKLAEISGVLLSLLYNDENCKMNKSFFSSLFK